MKEKCKEYVADAAGRPLTQKELKDIEDRVKRAMRFLASKDRDAWQSMTGDQRWREAAKAASEELQQEAIKAKVRTALTIQAHDKIKNYFESQKQRYGFNEMDSIQRYLDGKLDDKNNITSQATHVDAIYQDLARQFVGGMETLNPKLFGLFTNAKSERAVMWELFGKDSKEIADGADSGLAKQAAKQWEHVAELARTQFNNAGGDVGKLTDWRSPQSWSQNRANKHGQDEFVNDFLPALKRDRYVKEDGTLMGDDELTELLKESWTSIATGGANKLEPGKQQGMGMMANRHGESRVLHFRDPDQLLALQKKYGEKDMFSSMLGHLHGMAKDTASLEYWGPNPALQSKFWIETAVKNASVSNPKYAKKYADQALELENLFNYLSGVSNPVAGRKSVQLFNVLTHALVASKLGSAFISSLPDNATMYATAAVNNMPMMQLARNQLAYLNPANRQELRMARSLGLSLQTFTDSVNRWGTDALGGGYSSKLASLTIRASGLSAVTEGRRRAFGVTMYGNIGGLVKDNPDFSSLDPSDHRLLLSKGITEKDWNIWQNAKLENWGNGNDTMLTPESIYRVQGVKPAARRDAALKLIAVVNEEASMAVVVPTASIKAKIASSGILGKAVALFKTFSLAMMARHMVGRGWGMPTAGGRAAYIAGLVAATTVMGALAIQVRNLTSGNDPDRMVGKKGGVNAKFLMRSMMQGGSLGVYGDFLFSTQNRSGNSLLSYLGGPTASTAEDAINMTFGNLSKLSQHQKTTFGADAVKLAKDVTPLSNLWYTRAVTDRLIFNHLQEMASPGYMRRVDQRAKREFDQTKWWPSDSLSPKRAPNFGKAVGSGP